MLLPPQHLQIQPTSLPNPQPLTQLCVLQPCHHLLWVTPIWNSSFCKQEHKTFHIWCLPSFPAWSKKSNLTAEVSEGKGFQSASRESHTSGNLALTSSPRSFHSSRQLRTVSEQHYCWQQENKRKETQVMNGYLIKSLHLSSLLFMGNNVRITPLEAQRERLHSWSCKVPLGKEELVPPFHLFCPFHGRHTGGRTQSVCSQVLAAFHEF